MEFKTLSLRIHLPFVVNFCNMLSTRTFKCQVCSVSAVLLIHWCFSTDIIYNYISVRETNYYFHCKHPIRSTTPAFKFQVYKCKQWQDNCVLLKKNTIYINIRSQSYCRWFNCLYTLGHFTWKHYICLLLSYMLCRK